MPFRERLLATQRYHTLPTELAKQRIERKFGMRLGGTVESDHAARDQLVDDRNRIVLCEIRSKQRQDIVERSSSTHRAEHPKHPLLSVVEQIVTEPDDIPHHGGRIGVTGIRLVRVEVGLLQSEQHVSWRPCRNMRCYQLKRQRYAAEMIANADDRLPVVAGHDEFRIHRSNAIQQQRRSRADGDPVDDVHGPVCARSWRQQRIEPMDNLAIDIKLTPAGHDENDVWTRCQERLKQHTDPRYVFDIVNQQQLMP
jgi:hypothetical protein